MASGLSQYALTNIMNHILGRSAFTMPASVYVALLATAATSTNTGSTLSEVTYTGYARAQIPGASMAAATGSAGVASNTNSAQINWPACTGGSATAVAYAVCDALTGGNMLFFGVFPTSQAISNGITPDIPVSTLQNTLTESGGITDYLAKKILDHLMGKTAIAMPTLYVGLSTATLSYTSLGTAAGEPAYTGYTRTAVGAATFPAPTVTTTQASSTSTATVTMAQCTGGTATITSVFIADSSGTGTGNLLFYGSAPSYAISSGITPVFPAGQLAVTLTNS